MFRINRVVYRINCVVYRIKSNVNNSFKHYNLCGKIGVVQGDVNHF